MQWGKFRSVTLLSQIPPWKTTRFAQCTYRLTFMYHLKSSPSAFRSVTFSIWAWIWRATFGCFNGKQQTFWCYIYSESREIWYLTFPVPVVYRGCSCHEVLLCHVQLSHFTSNTYMYWWCPFYVIVWFSFCYEYDKFDKQIIYSFKWVLNLLTSMCRGLLAPLSPFHVNLIYYAVF